MFSLGVALVIALVVVVAVVVWQVDDWSRDLSINYAATSPSAADEGLRPLELSLPLDEAAALVERAALSLPRWSPGERNSEGDALRLRFVRQTPLLRFRDDVTVVLRSGSEGRTVVDVESRSRVGKADFGQNPRNIKELLAALRAQRDGASPAR